MIILLASDIFHKECTRAFVYLKHSIIINSSEIHNKNSWKHNKTFQIFFLLPWEIPFIVYHFKNLFG